MFNSEETSSHHARLILTSKCISVIVKKIMKLNESDLTNFDLYRSDDIKPELKSAMALTALDILNQLPCGEKRRPEYTNNNELPPESIDASKVYRRNDYFGLGVNKDEVKETRLKLTNRVLLRDLTNVTKKYSKRYGFYATSGDLHCLYTGRDISFRPKDGAKISSVIEVDHVVPLEDIWRSDRGLSPQARHELFGNDLEVQAVAKSANQEKGSDTFEEWPMDCSKLREDYIGDPIKFNKLYLAQYAVRQVAIKNMYGLCVDRYERDYLNLALTRAAKQA